VLLAAGAGAMGVLAFPRIGGWPFALISIALLCLATRDRRPRDGAWLGLVYGIALFAGMLHWTSTFVGAPPWLILAFSQSWFTAALGAVLPVLQRRADWPVTVACAWVAEEALRDRIPFGGFPWGRWAFSQSQSPLRWWVVLGGAPLLTFVTALAGCCLAAVLVGGTSRRRVVAAVTLAALFGLSLLSSRLTGPGAHEPTVRVAAIQGSVPDRGLEFNARRRQVLDNHVNQTLALAAQIKAGKAPQPAVVLWPENASDIDPLTNADAYAEIQQAVDAVGVPILVGALLDGPGDDHVSNVGIVWGPTNSPQHGPGQTYTKRHPVPFGEYIPLRGIAKMVSNKVNLVGRDMIAGTGNGLLSTMPFPIGDVICFEIAEDGLVRSSVAAGARLLVVQTNNATFGHSAETYQQLAMSRLRSLEYGRTVVQVATSGKSAIFGPTGQLLESSGRLFTPAILEAQVPLSTSRTLATRSEAWVEWLLTLVAVAALVRDLARWAGDRRRQARMYDTTATRGSAAVLSPTGKKEQE